MTNLITMHRLLLPILFLPLIFSPFPVISQNTNDTIDVPGLINKPDYSELATFTSEGVFLYSVLYDEPHSADEEFAYKLQFSFHYPDSIKTGQVFDLAKDTNTVHSRYGILSPWIWDFDKNPAITGTIKIISKKRKEVVIEEDVIVREEDGRVLLFKGRKTFKHVKVKY